MSRKLRVDTLDQEVLFDGQGFRVGCQNISYEDAKEIADFIHTKVKEVVPFEQGGVYDTGYGGIYMLAQVGVERFNFINVVDGNRKNYAKSKEEVIKYLNSGKVSFLASSVEEYYKNK